MPSIRANDLPDYAQRRGDPCFPPPYTVDKAGMDIFICEGDDASLRAMVERALNKPTERQFGTRKPLRFELDDRRVGFACIDVKRLRSPFGDQRERENSAGIEINEIYARQTEVAVMVQVRDNHGLPYWYLPYVLNSLPTAITTGREIYGYPKQQAYFVPYDVNGSPQPLPFFRRVARAAQFIRGRVDRLQSGAAEDPDSDKVLFGLDKRWDSLSVQAYDVDLPGRSGIAEFLRKEVLRFKRGRPALVARVGEAWAPQAGPNDFEFFPDYWPKDPAPERASNDPARESKVQEFGLPVAANSAADDFLHRIRSDVPYVFLRQFRDPQDPRKASCQSLVLGRLIPDSADQLQAMKNHDYTVMMPWAFNLALAEQVFGQRHVRVPGSQQPRAVERPVVGLLSGRDATFKVLDATVVWEFGSNMVSDDRRLNMLDDWLTHYAKAVKHG